MKGILLITCSFLISIATHAQTYLWGTSSLGGINDKGVLFQYDPATSAYTKKIDFDGTTKGANPFSSLVKGTDGKLYGVTVTGGINNKGVLFQYDPATSTFTKKLDFNGSANGANPSSHLLQASDGKLYGMTSLGGTNDKGVLFQYDPATSTYTKKIDFDGISKGANPTGSLTQATDGKLYGMTSFGGINNLGIIFQYDPATSVFTKKLDFNGAANGAEPHGSLKQATDGKLYAMTRLGGSNSKGVLFQYNISTSTYTKKVDFNGTARGAEPHGSLLQATDGKLYGMTRLGGTNDLGVIFHYDPATSTFTKKLNFSGSANGSRPYGSFIQAADGKLYGMTFEGGTNGLGVLFQYNPTTSTYTKKLDFNGTANGKYPVNLIEAEVAANTITTSAVNSTNCAGNAINVSYTATGTFNAGNIFTAQLSNAAGSFASPVAIGTLSSTTAGTINAVLPSNTPSGTAYRIRVISSNPAVTGTDNGSNITINALPTVTANASATTVCAGTSVTLTGSGAVSYVWTGGVTDGVGFVPVTTTTYTVTGTDANGCTDTDTKTITVNPLPTVTANASATTVCAGTSVTLTGSGAVTYAWTGGVSNGVGFIPSATTTYTVTGTDANGCTDTDTKTITVNPSTTSSTNHTACNSYLWNGTTYTASGTYTYTTTNAAGCDSVATLNLVINNSSSSTTNHTACNSYLWNGTTYTASGTYTYTTTNAAGCDSVATLNLVINNSSTSTTTQTACDSLTWNGTTYTATGTYTYTTTNVTGCDSVATLNLTINNSSTSTTTQTACDSLTWNGTTYTASGTYTYTTTNATGCDSVATLNLTINNSSTSSTTQTACDSYVWNATTYTASGTYTYTTTNTAGCDSVAILNLTINNSTSSSTTHTACDSYLWNATTYTASGIYTYTTTNTAGCDSVATLNLTINNSSSSTNTQTACDSYVWNATTYTATGTYTYTTTNAAGCDSVATLNLVINNSSTSTTNHTACNSYLWNGTTYTASGTYTYTATNAAGCDSVATLNLVINNSSTSTTNYTACNSYLWNGITYTASGTYTYTTTNAAGCDSVATLNLTINPFPSVVANASATTVCAGTSVTLTGSGASTYAWTGGVSNGVGFVPTVTNTYTVTGTDVNGCTNTATITITVNPIPAQPAAFTTSSSSVNRGQNGVVYTVPNDPSVTYIWAYSGTGATINGSGNSVTIDFSLSATGGTLSVTATNGCNSAARTLAITIGTTGPSSSQSPYLLPTVPTATFTAILTANDVVSGYKMVGIPDGLGAYDNGNGTFTVLMNHEIPNTSGVVRAHGSKGAFVSKWVIDKSNLSVISGADLTQTVKIWNGSGYDTYNSSNPSPLSAFGRFCSADLPAVSAFYNNTTGLGTQERIFMNGEESGNEGRAFGHIATGAEAGTTYELPYLGKFSWENSVALPLVADKTVVAGLDDSTPGQVYFYIGTKTNIGTDVDKAGLNNGKLYGVAITGLISETNASVPSPGTAFTLVDLGQVQNLSGATINTNSNNAGVTTFLRPEDGAWDPSNLNDFYFVTTNAFASPSRLWKLHFANINNPELGGTITAVLDGTEGQRMFDNMTIDNSGHVLLQEDVGNNVHLGKVWQYTIATDVLTLVGEHDPTRFITGAPNFLTQDEESSGMIDVQNILGPGKFLVDVQAHYSIAGEVFEGGQLLAYYNPDTYASNPEINVQANSLNILDGDATPRIADNTHFGSVSIGNTVAKPFVIQNTGTGPLSVSGINFTGANASEFTLVNPPAFPLSIAASSSYTITTRFAPIAVGARAATINILNTDFDESTYDFALSGTSTDQPTGPSSSQSPYLLPTVPTATFTAILTAGDTVAGGYKMCGLPDGLGVYDNGDSTFTLLMNHEIGSASGVVRDHGSKGAFVSKWVINKSNLSVVSGADLIQTVKLWNGSGYTTYNVSTPSPLTAFDRFCSADLPLISAFYNSATGAGTQERIFLNGEESGDDGRAFGHIATGAEAGTTYELPYLGKFSWENSVALPLAADKTVVAGLDDSTPGQVYFYIGTKTNTGTDIDKAGLSNGKLYGVAVSGLLSETSASVPPPGTSFSLMDLGQVQNMNGATLNTNSNNAGVTAFLRPEDGAWDPLNPSDFYFVTTNAFSSPSRLWKLHFTDINNPELGGAITAVLAGTEGQKMFDNMGFDNYGHILLQEDVGNNVHNGKVWQYTTVTDALIQVGQHDPSRFISGGANFLTQDEESSGIIDVQYILGQGNFILVDQAHYTIPGEVVQGGQLLAYFNPDTYNAPPNAFAVNGGGSYCSGDTSGVAVGLADSESGVEYQLILNGTTNVGTPVTGTGSALSFGNHAAAGVYTVLATNTTTSNTAAMTGSVNITVNSLPTVTAAATDTIVCTGTSVTLTGSGAATYSWTGGVTDGVGFTPAATDTYIVTGTDANGCSNTDTIIIIVNPIPDNSVSANGPTAFCPGDSVILSVITGGAGYTYLWSNGATTQSMVVDSTGNYSVIITNADGCSVASLIVTVTVNTMPEDLNGDGIVNTADFLLFLTQFGNSCTCLQDINGDGIVNTADFLLFLTKFGTACN